jgi:hypothetical protein
MTGGAHGGDVAEAVSPLSSATACGGGSGDGKRGGGGGERRCATKAVAAACGGVRRRCAALLRDERRHVEGEMKRYLKDKIMSGHKFAERGGGGGRSANLCFYDRHTYLFIYW